MKPVVLPDLRFRRTWLAIGIAMLLVILVVCLVPNEQLPDVPTSDKFKHVLSFAALAFWFGSIVMRYDLPWLALLLVSFGGLIEIAQGTMHMGRSAEWLDLAADALGVALGIGLALTPLGRWARWAEAKLAGLRA